MIGGWWRTTPGLRLIRQDPWECAASYVLATNANIPRIQKMIENVCRTFGDRLPGGGHAFPRPDQIAVERKRPRPAGWVSAAAGSWSSPAWSNAGRSTSDR
jgi:hypothetical protein